MIAPPIARPADDSADWTDFFHTTIATFWQQQVVSESFTAFDGIQLHCNYYNAGKSAPLVVIAPGRIEAALKYQEVFWELAQQGISVAALDHRGQGLSDRLTTNRHQGHVEHFDDFVRDFADFTERLIERFGSVPKVLFGHSMGGTIATLYCATYPHRYDRLVLSAPMFSIDTGRVPYWLARCIVAGGAWINRLLATPWYFFGMRDYQAVPFEDNVLTHSRQRYQAFRHVYHDVTEIQLGGPTFNWLYEAISAAIKAQQLARDIRIPVTLFQAGADAVVSAKGQQAAVANLMHPNVRFMTVKGAYHELMMESDTYRQPVLDALIEETQSAANDR